MAWIFLVLAVYAMLCSGCAHRLTKQTQITISQNHQAAAVAQAKAQDDADVAIAQETARQKLNQLRGAGSPISHPIAATNNTIVRLHKWLFWITLASSFLWAIQFGLSKAGYGFLGFLAPVLRWVAVLSFCGLMALPFLPLGFAAAGVLLAGLFVYELVRNKGDVKEAIGDTEHALGFKCPSPENGLSDTTTGTPARPILVPAEENNPAGGSSPNPTPPSPAGTPSVAPAGT